MSDRIMNSRKTRRRLAPSEKYEMFVSVLTGQATQREAVAQVGRGPLHRGARVPDRETGRAVPRPARSRRA